MVSPDTPEGDPQEKKNPKVTLKVLIPPNVAGSVIGKNGEQIKNLKSKTKAHIKVSNRHEVFPYTNERIILLIAPIENAMEAISFIHSKIRSKSIQGVSNNFRQKELKRRQNEMKIIIADTTAGKIIGKKGETVKKIQDDYNVKVMLTSKDDWGVVPGERVATIVGEENDVNTAIEYIITKIQEDPYARLNRSLVYPPYPMFDYHGFMGPPQDFYSQDEGGPKEEHRSRGYNDFPPRYNGYQRDRFMRPRGPPANMAGGPRRSY